MAALARWYLVAELLGLLVWPLAWRLFRRLPDRGYGVSKALGVLLIGVTLWVGTAGGILRNDAGGAVLAVLAVALLALAAGWPGLRLTADGRRPLVAWMRSRVGPLLAIEAVFLLAVGGWAFVRAHDPAVRHTEQPMDLLFVSAIWTSPTFPPRDPWLAGYATSYYYLGYWLLATLGRLAATPPEITYNVGQACWFGFLLVGSYSLGANLVALGGRPGAPGRRRSAGLGGLLTACAVALAANLHGVVVALQVGARWLSPGGPAPGGARLPAEPLWWWPSSRVLGDVDLTGRPIELIAEFPFFSYFLGDDHPHLLAMPFDLLVIALALTLFLTRGRAGDSGGGWPGRGRALLETFPLGATGAVVVVVAAGALGALNPWDFPAAWLLLVVACVAAARRAAGGPAVRHRVRRRVLAVSLLVPVGAGLLCLPFLLTAQSQVSGVLPNLFHPTPLGRFASVFGGFAPGAAALAWASWQERHPPPARLGWGLTAALGVPILGLATALWGATSSPTGRAWLASLPLPPGATSPLAFALDRWRSGWPTAALLAALLGLAGALLGSAPGPQTAGRGRPRWQRRDAALDFALVLLVVGLALLLVPEVAYLRDLFGTRMNTVFKLYYQAWLLVAVAAAAGAVASLRHGGICGRLGGVAAAVLVVALAYAAVGIAWKVTSRGPGPLTLDGLAYLETEAPDELAAIRWIRANTRPDAQVVQAVGDSYRADDGRISVATGRATLLGWRGHERQWRGEGFDQQAADRTAALEEIYRASTPERLRRTLVRWGVSYVYLGPRERARYGTGPQHEAVLAEVMEVAFQHGDVRIFRRRGPERVGDPHASRGWREVPTG